MIGAALVAHDVRMMQAAVVIERNRLVLGAVGNNQTDRFLRSFRFRNRISQALG